MNNIRDFVFEEECVNIPTFSIDNDQDNDEEPHTSNQKIVTEEQNPLPQEPMP